MTLYRFMGRDEYARLIAGETLTNHTDWFYEFEDHSSESVGFCFCTASSAQWDSPQDFYVLLTGGEAWQRVGFAPDDLGRESRVCVKFEVSDDMVHESRASYYYGEPCVREYCTTSYHLCDGFSIVDVLHPVHERFVHERLGERVRQYFPAMTGF